MKQVLFVCNHNAGRSQMAQAFLERFGPADVEAASAGSEPRAHVLPTVIEAMREVGIDLSGRRPQKLTLEAQLHADWAITMGCGDACPYVPTQVEDWDVPDPSDASLDEVRRIRDQIAGRVQDLVTSRLDQLYNDRTAHQLRVSQMLPSLVEQFEGKRSPAEIRDCLDRILDLYEDTQVRSFVQVLAHRRTSQCLSREACDPRLVTTAADKPGT
jgi:arsenate reductase